MRSQKGINNNSRTVNSIRNISTGVFSQVIYAVLGFISRTIFIKYLAVEYLGVHGLFSSILSVLALAELGVGSAFIYSLYKPLADKNQQLIAAIMALYKKVYHIIGIGIFIAGLAILPFLSQIVTEKSEVITESISVIYILFLFSTASSYFFSFKVSLINADQRNYITTYNYLGFYVLQNILQILVLIIFKNFLYYLITQIVCQFLSNLSISILANKYYPFLKTYKKSNVDKPIIKELISNTKATFIIKVGGILVNATDNIIINFFSGLALIGLASNYYLLIGMVSTLIAQLFNNISSSIAQINTVESKEKQYETFKTINFANFWIYGFSAISFVILANDFITLWIGKDYTLPMSISTIMAINFFMVGVQGTNWTFKGSYGFFNQGKYLVLVTALLNLGFSFLLGHYWGLLGIFMATAIARLLTNFWYDPYIVFKLGLKIRPTIYVIRFLKFVGVLVLSAASTYLLAELVSFNLVLNLIVKGLICLIVPNVIIIFMYKNSKDLLSVKTIALNAYKTILKK